MQIAAESTALAPTAAELERHGIRVDLDAQSLPRNVFDEAGPGPEARRLAPNRLLRDVVRAVGRSPLGRRLMQVALAEPESLAWLLNGLSDRLALRASFDQEAGADAKGAGEARGFEDCAWLFSSNCLNHGLSRLNLAEASYLFRVVRSLEAPRVAEIGRYRGGTTLLLAAAGASVVSIDNDHAQLRLARELTLALDRHALRDRVEIVIGDSRTHALEPGSFDVVFADGDHSYEGVRADFEHWWPALADGGHMLLHDAVPASAGIVPPPREHTEGVERLLAEVVERSDVIRVPIEAGTIAHVVKRVVSDGERTGRRSPAAW